MTTSGMTTLAAVIFDVDDTLFASERSGHRVAFNRAFDYFELPEVWDEQRYAELVKIAGGRQRLAHWFTHTGHDPGVAEELARIVHRRKTAIVRDLASSGRIPLRPGVRALVRNLAGAGISMHIATTGTREWVEPLLARHFPPGTFDVVVTGSDVHDLKPSPAAYRTVLSLARLDPTSVVAIEDSRNGLRAAQAAGLTCVVACGDYTDAGEVASADLLVESLTHINVARLDSLLKERIHAGHGV